MPATSALALAIGITTAVYSTVHHFMRVDYGIDDRASLSDIRENRWARPLSWPDFRDIAADQESFAQLAAWSRVVTNLSADDTTQMAWGEIVSGTYFAVLGAQPTLGRLLSPADDVPTAPPAVVLAATTARTCFEDQVTARTSLAATLYFPDVSVTPAIAATTFLVTVSGMVMTGLLPAWSLTRRGLRESIASGSDTALPRWRGRSNLIAVQVGVSVGLFLLACHGAA